MLPYLLEKKAVVGKVTKIDKEKAIKIAVPITAILIFLLGIFAYFNTSRPLIIKYDGLPEREYDSLAETLRTEYSIPEVVKPGTRITLPEIKFKDYTFRKWNDADGKEIDFITWKMSDALGAEIHAVFEPKYYKILYTDGNENVIKEAFYLYGESEQIEDGSVLSDSSGFVGWADETGEIIKEVSEKVKGDIRLHPVFQGDGERSPEKKETLSENKDYIKIGEYFAYLYTGTDQDITDAENSANYFIYKGKEVITDHRSQGIDAVMTNNKATLCRDGELHELTCIYRKQGYNKEDKLVLLDGTDAFDAYDDYSTLIYTCNDIDGVSISITFWKEMAL